MSDSIPQNTKTNSNKPFSAHFTLVSFLTAFLLIVTTFIYWPTAQSAFQVWINTETFKHCFFVVPIVLFLLWDKKEIFKTIPAVPYLPALLLAPFIGIGWAIAHIASINIGEHLMLVAFFQVIILTMFGYRLYWALLFPFSFLWFLVPFGEYFIPMLQNITTWFSLLFLTLVNIPYYNDGIFISVPNGNFEVAEACAGLRFLIATIVLGCLFAYLFYKSTFRRLLFIVLSFVIPIFANGIRAFGIIFIAYMTDNEYAVGVDHLVYGWFFFAFVLALLIGIGLLFREDTTKEKKDNFEIYASKETQTTTQTTIKQFIIAAVLALILIVPARFYGHHLDQLSILDTSQFSSQKLTLKSPLTATSCPSDWTILFEGSSVLTQCANLNNQLIQIKIVYYPHQNKDHSLLSFKNQFYDDKSVQWKKTNTFLFEQNNRPIPLNLQTFLKRGEDISIATTYWVNGVFINNKIKIKINQAMAQIKNGYQAGFLVMILLPNAVTNDDAQKEIETILQSLPDLNELFSKVANSSHASKPQS